jgi:hypothetical protein
MCKSASLVTTIDPRLLIVYGAAIEVDALGQWGGNKNLGTWWLLSEFSPSILDHSDSSAKLQKAFCLFWLFPLPTSSQVCRFSQI